MTKEWYMSKTFWINVIGIAVIITQSKLGFVIDAGMQTAILAFINIGLRQITKEEIVWVK
jgi:hypothetical protein